MYYKFNANVLVGTYYNQKGELRGEVENKDGNCKLNKLTEGILKKRIRFSCQASEEK